MKIKRKQCFLLLMLSIIFILSVGLISASEVTNETTEIVKNKQEVSLDDTYLNEAKEKSISHTSINRTTKSSDYLYVTSDANSSNDGSTKSSATTLENAINNANSGQTIYLTTSKTQDTYKLTSAISVYYKSLNIVGESGKTIILDGQHNSYIFYFKGSTISLSNIQVVNSDSSTAAISAIDSDLTVSSSTFKNNKGSISGSILCRDSNLKITDCIFTNNTSENLGGAVTQLGNKSLTITGSTFSNNTAKYDGGSVYSIQSKVSVSLSVFNSNKAKNGGALYLGNNVNRINLEVTDSVFNNNKASVSGDSIWTNYHITVNNNAFVSTNKNDWIRLDKNCVNDISLNWWSLNSPNFNVITGGVVPDSWRLLKVTNQTSSNTNKLTVSLNNLSNSKTTATNLPARQVTYSADSGSFDSTSQSITSSVVNSYHGTDTNVKVKVDNQELKVNTKLDTYLSINNITSTSGSTVKFNICTNPEINDKVTIHVNNVTLTPSLTNGKVSYSYTIPSTWKVGNYTTTLTYAGNGLYQSKTIKGYLLVKSKNIVIMPVTNNDITLKSVTLPKSYDLRNLSQVTPVKSQGSSGSCWAFSSLSSLESALLKKTGVSYDLSENNMKNVLKKYSVIGDSSSNPNSGFNDLEPIGYLVGWYGPVNESLDAYSPSSYVSPLMTPDIHVQDVYFIPNRKNFTDNYLIKQAVYLFGGVSTGIAKPTSTNSYTTGKSIDHSVTIVGWDDNYSKTNFSPNAPGDGAFIIKNSWGNSTGKNGYHYISYYDESIASIGITDATSEQINYVPLLENKDNYTSIYHYDISVSTLDASSLTDYIAYKNVYTTTKDENLAAFGSYFLQESNYTISFYTGGKLLYSQPGQVKLPGYRTIRLDKFVQVPADEEFTVVLTIRGKDEKPVVVEYTDHFYSSIHTNTSLLSFDGKKWEDLYEYECVAPIKLYTKDTPIVTSTATENNEVVTVTTKINNTKASGYLTYYANNQAVKVNGNMIKKSVTKDSIVTVKFNDTTNLKNYKLTVVYTSENYAIKENISMTNNQLKASTITVKTSASSVIGNNITISGTLSSDKKLSNSKVVIYVNTNRFTVTTDANGNYKLVYQTKTVGSNQINVTYAGNSNYSGTTNTTKFNVLKKTTKITLNKISSVMYTNNATITGKLTAGSDALSNQVVYVYINGAKKSTKTDSKGIFTYKFKTNKVGKNNVTVSYAGNSMYNTSKSSTTFTVKAMTTKITVSPISQVAYTDKVKITGKYQTTSGVELGNTVLTVKINGAKKRVQTDVNGKFTLKVTAKVMGTNKVTVTYSGNARYKGATKNATFKVTKKATKLTLNSISSVSYTDKFKVKGKFSTSSGVTLRNSLVNVTVNGVKKSVKTNNNGVYTLVVSASKVGTTKVTVSFKGNSKYKATNANRSFKVTKKATKLTLNSISSVSYSDKFKVKGKFSTSSGVVLRNSLVNVTVNGVKKSVKTNNKGVYSLVVSASKVGTTKVTVSFAGNARYKSTNQKVTFNVTSKATKLTVNTANNVKMGKKILIKGRFTTSSGKYLKNSIVNLLVNNMNITLKTNNEGIYSYNYMTSKSGTNNILVLFGGNKLYKASYIQSSFYVEG